MNIKLKYISIISTVVFLVMIFITRIAFAASCPYCFQVYGEGSSGSGAYLAGIRAQHEATCPSRPTGSTESGSYEESDDSYQEEQQRQQKLEQQRRAQAQVEQEKQEKAEQERQEQARQKQFFRDKQGALNQLKGISGGSSETKAVAPSFKSGPVDLGLKGGTISQMKLKSVSPTDSGLKSPKFSKGTKTSAPVDIRSLDVASGQAFKSNQDVIDFIEKADWTTRVKARVVLGLLMAGQGRYDEAIAYLQKAAVEESNESLITTVLENVMNLKEEKEKITQGAGHLKHSVINPDEFTYLPPQAQVDLVIAKASVSVGDYDNAVKSLHAALMVAPTDKKLRDALIYARQLKIARDEKISGKKPDPAWLEEAASRAKANAAWGLGLYLSEKGDYIGAVKYLKETQQVFSDGYTNELLGKLIDNVDTLAPLEDIVPTFPTKADAILDALEYGKGDWQRSLKYLEVAHKSDPDNMAVRDAFNYLEGLHAGISN